MLNKFKNNIYYNNYYNACLSNGFENIIIKTSGPNHEILGNVESENILFKYDITLISYTTGTTGPQKGVMLSHRNLLSATNNINKFIGIDSGVIESVPMRLSHSFGFARLRCIFEVGGTVVLENGLLRPEKVLTNIKKYKVNALSLVPSGFTIILDYYKDLFKTIAQQIKHIEIGSSQMYERHKIELIKLCPKARICMHYGLTEASRSTMIEFNSEKQKLHTVGRASPNVKIRIVNNLIIINTFSLCRMCVKI